MLALDTVQVYARPLAVCVFVAGTCFGVRRPTPLAVFLAKAFAVAFGASELIASDLVSFRFHGEHSPRDFSIHVKGLASVRVNEPATPVAAGIVLWWAVWMARAVRDMYIYYMLGRDDFWERALAPPREEARAPPRHQRTDEEVKEVVAFMALARNFDRLRFGVKVLREQRRRRAQRAADQVREDPRMAGDESPPSSTMDDHRGMQAAASSSSLPPSALRKASRSSSTERVRFRHEVAEYFHYECESLSADETPMQSNDRAMTEVECLQELQEWLGRVDAFVTAQMQSTSAEAGAEAAQEGPMSTSLPPPAAPSPSVQGLTDPSPSVQDRIGKGIFSAVAADAEEYNN